MSGFNHMRHWLFAMMLGLAVVITGCGSDGTTDMMINPGSGGTGSSEPIHASGTVSDEEPLTVNGVRYDTTLVAVVDDQDNSVSRSVVAKGMVVEITGDIALDGSQSGTASVVRLRSLARGKISRVLTAGFIVNGLAIRADASTKRDEATVIAAGNTVEVFGFVDHETGIALATYVRPDAFDTLKLTGSVDFYDDNSGHLVVNGLSLEAGQGAGLSLQNGNRVVVLANPSAGPSNSTVVRVDPERATLPGFGAVSVEGIIGNYDSLTGFEVNGLPVDASSASVTGSTGLGVESGWRVQVTGRVVDEKIRARSIVVVSTEPGINLQVR